jgi:hypothetical protein
MEQSTAFSDLIDKLKAQATETQTATREKLTTEKPAGLGIEGITSTKGPTSISDQLSSLQKVGGGGGGIVQNTIADQQLKVQEIMSMHLQRLVELTKGNQSGGGAYGGMVLTA